MTTSADIMATAAESLAFWRPLVRLPDVHPWALMGDEAGESSFLPRPEGDKVNGEPTAFGLMQWHAARIAVLAGPPPHGCGIDIRTASHLDQLRAAHFEMTSVTGFRHVWDELMAEDTIEGGCTVLVVKYERSLHQATDIAKRTALALKWQARLGSPPTA